MVFQDAPLDIQAVAELNQLQHDEPDCALYALFLERIRQWRLQPPLADWDGAHICDNKYAPMLAESAAVPVHTTWQ
ncbi:hypothetical protein [Chitinolyticbacter albus]|uniref:hypothetical protein n=1 Tax=Chitinolyticbacter albus TaxID=2961951 RepID=UPI00210D2F79|nr:hypothetical protein [Chitinolyticbacter albus]